MNGSGNTAEVTSRNGFSITLLNPPVLRYELTKVLLLAIYNIKVV